MTLSKAEIRRYSRHLLLPEVSVAGQERLKRAAVLVVGAGGLGSPVAMYLAAAGVGRLGVVDADVVSESNLQRQILHGQRDLGAKKVASATARLAEVNPFCVVEAHGAALDRHNASALIARYDLVVDATDNFAARYLINDACVLAKKPDVYASLFQFEGQVTVFDATRGPCYRCLYPAPPPAYAVPSCAEGGVLGALAGVIGSLQATEALKLIVGFGEPLIGRLLLYDAMAARFRELTAAKNPACPACGTTPTLTALVDYDQLCGVPTKTAEAEISPHALRDRTQRAGLLLLDVRESHEWEIGRIDGARLIPMAELPARLHELDSTADIVVYCRDGTRSAGALTLLRNAGFTRVAHLRGGINAWSEAIDPNVPVY